MSSAAWENLFEIFGHLKYVDDADVHERAKSNPALAAAYKMVRPSNWLDSGLPADVPPKIAIENGIPVVWVPPPQVLAELAAVEPDQRMSVLRYHEESVLDLCAWLIEESDDPALWDAQTLARNALRAFTEGHHQAAMTLAVAVSEGLALWAANQELLVFDSEEERTAYEESLREAKKADEIQSVKYERAEHLLGHFATREDRSLWLTYWRAVLSPIPRFFAPYYAERGDPIPATTSRHVTAHSPSVAHLSEENSLIAIMLCSSLLREKQSWHEYEREQQIAWEESVRDQQLAWEEQAGADCLDC